MVDLKEKRRSGISARLRPVADAVESWLLDESMQFLKCRKFTPIQEALIEEFQDYLLEKVEKLK